MVALPVNGRRCVVWSSPNPTNFDNPAAFNLQRRPSVLRPRRHVRPGLRQGVPHPLIEPYDRHGGDDDPEQDEDHGEDHDPEVTQEVKPWLPARTGQHEHHGEDDVPEQDDGPADDLREVTLASLAKVPRLFPFECLGEFFLCPVPFLP